MFIYMFLFDIILRSHSLQTPHPEYLALGKTKEQRLNNYRELFKAHIEIELLTYVTLFFTNSLS